MTHTPPRQRAAVRPALLPTHPFPSLPKRQTNRVRVGPGTAAFLLLALLPGCLAAPIDRADSALERRVEQLGAEATRTAQETTKRLDEVRAAALEDAQRRADAVRAAALADVDARLESWLAAADRRISDRIGDVDGRLERRIAEAREALEAARAESEAWRETMTRAIDESAGWRDESAKWRGEIAGVRAALTGSSAPAAGGSPGPSPDPVSTEDKYALWFAVAGSVFTLAKTAHRYYAERASRRAAS